ncbi:hypothetical protein E8E15_004661 [Penicillium rubens]|uniref:Pc13g11910 protein n=1 Tax=Penicillium rubens (strain ATCC 28089 / DSM 1075 / NRRL 1951 / Wisconsin 54-1255) TaxID=500485 RepID=B6H524_PENRW|nr:hypothetical protein E8E15_004661 [Penicillium rubens]CAP92260.1 Pc13g11910 [Penicillium rubens Wisconsin 54-1255]
MSDTFVGSVRKEDTIYRNGVVPDKSFQIDINFAKMESVSGTSSIFHVSYYGKPRVLKVFRNKTDPGHADDHIRDLDRSRCEIRAYCTLKRSKLCDAGVVPNFYGFMLAVDPANCAHLDAFRHDKGFHVLLLPYTSACKIFLLQLT